MAEDGGTILRAGVAALTVERGRIVDGEEDLEEIPIGRDLRVETDLNRFRVTRLYRCRPVRRSGRPRGLP